MDGGYELDDVICVKDNADKSAELKKKRTFRKFSYRGIELEQYVPSMVHLDFE
jgi:hypothetical protein